MMDLAKNHTTISLLGARVIDPAQQIDCALDLHIADGKILKLGAAPDGFQAALSLDLKGKILCPGLVDLCVRLREPGLEHKGTIESETRAAAAGGITTLCCPPDTNPIVDTPAVAELIRQCAEQTGAARVLPLGALTHGLSGNQLSEYGALKKAGCVGVSNSDAPMQNTLVLRRALEYAATHDMTVFLNPEDQMLRGDGCVHEGAISTRLGLPGIPTAAETAAIAQQISLIEQTGVRAHFCQLSTRQAVRMVARARFDGLPISADVSAHHLFLTDEDIGNFNPLYHIMPPLRTMGDRDGLRSGIKERVLSAICSDHQPHEPDAKLAPFPATEPGISALETLLALTLRFSAEMQIPLIECLHMVTAGPAAILGIDKGTLKEGRSADICVFDPQREWTLSTAGMLSLGRNTPFLHDTLRGKTTLTLLNGQIVYRDEQS